jgi:hypothetical protein
MKPPAPVEMTLRGETGMMDDRIVPHSSQLHTELWTSWASLLRSYTGAHGLNSTHHAVVEVGPTEIILRVDTRWLRFTPTSMTSSLHPEHPEPFNLEEDGTVTLNNTREEMDLLAERLAREIMSMS